MGRALFVSIGTLVVLSGYAKLLGWSFDTGRYWVLPFCTALLALAGYALSSPAERAEFSQEVRNLMARLRP